MEGTGRERNGEEWRGMEGKGVDWNGLLYHFHQPIRRNEKWKKKKS
jgi:hypothetical protein